MLGFRIWVRGDCGEVGGIVLNSLKDWEKGAGCDDHSGGVEHMKQLQSSTRAEPGCNHDNMSSYSPPSLCRCSAGGTMISIK